MDCNHKTFLNHTAAKVHSTDPDIWICTICGCRGNWDGHWTYYGDIECRECGRANVIFVTCSNKCLGEAKKKQAAAQKMVKDALEGVEV